MRIVGALATGGMLLQLGGCSFGPFLRQAEIGFAQSFGAYAAGLLIGQFAPADGPGPICIGPGCGNAGDDPE